MKGLISQALLPIALISIGHLFAQDVPKLDSYPKADKIWLGAFGGEVEVNPKTELLNLRFGKLHWLVQDGGEVKEGDVIAYSAYDNIQHSKSQLDLLEAEHEMRLRTAVWDHLEEATGLEKKAAALQSDIAKFTFSDSEKKLAGADLSARVENHRKQLEEQLDALKEQLDPEHRAGKLRVARQKIINELERSRIDHRELLDNHAVYAAHDGVVHHEKEGEVRQGLVIGQLERRGRAVVTIKVIDPAVISHDPELLSVSVLDRKGRSFKGEFLEVERLPLGASGPQTYRFQLRDNGQAKLDADMTGESVVTIHRGIGQEAFIVPKTKFLFSQTEKVQKLGWPGFIKSMWPDAEIVYIGPKSIAVVEGS